MCSIGCIIKDSYARFIFYSFITLINTTASLTTSNTRVTLPNAFAPSIPNEQFD